MVGAKCLKLIWNHSGIICGTYFSPFQWVYYLYRGVRRALNILALFWNLNDFPQFFEWIILLNILDSIEWIFFLKNIPDFVFNWIIFRPDSMKKWILKWIVQGYHTVLEHIITFFSHKICDVLFRQVGVPPCIRPGEELGNIVFNLFLEGHIFECCLLLTGVYLKAPYMSLYVTIFFRSR